MKGTRWDLAYETMPWDLADAVVFDIGGILIDYKPKMFIERTFPNDAQKQRDMLARVFHGTYWPMLDRGVITNEEAADRLVQEFGGDEQDYMRALTCWIDLKEPLDEGFAAARLCKEKGKKLVLLSNYAEVSYLGMRERYKERFGDLFDGECISYRCHYNKPEREIYQTLIRENDLDPARSLFLDDTLANVIGAMECGINGFHMSEKGKMAGFFK